MSCGAIYSPITPPYPAAFVSMPSLRILACSVVRFMPSLAAAPESPPTLPPASCSARWMASRSAASRVLNRPQLAKRLQPIVQNHDRLSAGRGKFAEVPDGPQYERSAVVGNGLGLPIQPKSAAQDLCQCGSVGRCEFTESAHNFIFSQHRQFVDANRRGCIQRSEERRVGKE